VAFEKWLSAAAADGNFQVAIRGQKSMVCDLDGSDGNCGSYKNPNETDEEAMIRQLKYVQSHYFSNNAYMKIEVPGDGLGLRNIVTFFLGSASECEGCDWQRIKDAVGNNVLFMKQDKSSFAVPGFEGGYSWGPSKNTNGQNDWSYADDYINSTKTKPSNVLVWSDASKGFNDEDPNDPGSSIWGGPKRQAYQRCGHRWLDTWNHLQTGGSSGSGYQGSSHGLDAVLVPTWNDYEEGTEMETGIDNCLLAVNTDLLGNQLSWTNDWDESRTGSTSATEMEKTIHHYDFYHSDPGDANNERLRRFHTLSNPSPYASPYNPPGHSLDLSQFSIPCNAKIFVKAVGQPSITNRMTTKADAPSFCGNPPYTYIAGLELPTTDWSTLDDCGTTATCSTVLATVTVHTPPDAVKFSLSGASPPGFQIGRWLRTVDPSTGTAADFELDLWADLNAAAYSYSAGLVFELSHVLNGYWYHFQFKCDFSSWQIWDEVNDTWLGTGIACNRPAQDAYTRFTFHMQRLTGNMLRYKDLQVNEGTVSAINRDLAAQTTTFSNFNKIGVKLMGNAAMNDYPLYVDDLRLGYR
jgi:hypothetical protein